MKVKKLAATLLAAILVLSLGTQSFAQITEPKTADVVLTVTQVVDLDALKIGQTIPLKVSTLKKGSDNSIAWKVDGLNTDGTTFAVSAANYAITGDAVGQVVPLYNETTMTTEDFVVAKGSFTGYAAGTYQITATITLIAGKSDVSWVGSDSTTVTVVDPVKLTGFTAKNFLSTAVWNKTHTNIKGYDVSYDLYKVFSDGTQTLYQTGLVDAMGAGQKLDTLKIEFEGVYYSYTVTRS